MEAGRAPSSRPASGQEPLPPTRILVSGYPGYSQPHDLLEIFRKFGNVKIDKCNNWSATLSYPTEQEAQKAIQAHKKVNIYGYFLHIRPYSSRERNAIEENGRQQAAPKRELTRSKLKSVIIEPKAIDLSGDFHQQMDRILAAIRLTQEDVKALSKLYIDLESALQLVWPGCKAIPFGSITTGLGIKSSDADCFVSVPGRQGSAAHNHVARAKRALAQFPGTFAELLSIPRASTPLLKLFHVSTSTRADVSFKSPLGAANSRLLARLLHADPRALPLAVLLKYWARVHDLTGTGKLTNYALTLMLVFYFQRLPEPLLPSVESLQRDGANDFVVDRWNTGLSPGSLPPSGNESSISELLGGFFQFYASFNFDEMVVCPYLGTPLRKEAFSDVNRLPHQFERYKKNVTNNYVMPIRNQTPICVQDPFEQCHNVASTITSKLAVDIKVFLKFAADAYEKEKENNCRGFLPTILLQKPKLIRVKTHPEYRINFFPRIISTITDVDWKSVVRQLVMTIFESMMRIKLGKVEETMTTTDSKREKEKYIGTVTKAIWKKRKQFERLYSMRSDLSIEEKQCKITDEVISIEKQNINAEFQLKLTFCQDPKSAVVTIRFNTGDLEEFREFGKFFISVTQIWFLDLLKPHSPQPNCKDTLAKIVNTKEINNAQEDETDSDDEVNVTNKLSDIKLIENTEINNQTMNGPKDSMDIVVNESQEK